MKVSRLTGLFMALSLLVCMLGGAALAEAEGGVLAQIAGTYDELFPVITAEEYDQVWLDACAEFGDAENAAQYAEMLKSFCTAEIYGEEAVAAYADGAQARFNCSFIGGVAQITFADGHISGVDENGATVFDHDYAYAGVDASTGFAIYESADEASGEFTYFLLAPDTPAITHHIEFRYGADLEALGQFYEGAYAYWLAAGIPVDGQDAYAVSSIRLFCEENLAELAA